jgi:hypothetical protein
MTGVLLTALPYGATVYVYGTCVSTAYAGSHPADA